MKPVYLFLLLLLFCFNSCSSTRTATNAIPPLVQQPEVTVKPVNFSDATTWVLGYFKPARLNQEPHSAWYIKGIDNYTGNPAAIDSLRKMSKDELSVKVILGTWCPDSRREVPRFMRIIREIDFPVEKISFIGVDNMKVAPVDNYSAFGIERVPTFIFYKNNVETGRIIEVPSTSLEQDMVNILIRNEKK